LNCAKTSSPRKGTRSSTTKTSTTILCQNKITLNRTNLKNIWNQILPLAWSMRLDVIGGAPASSNPAAYVLATAESNLCCASIAAAIEICSVEENEVRPGDSTYFPTRWGAGHS
jgi:hypothetical protein